MFSRFLGKGKDTTESSSADSASLRGLEVVENDPDTTWGMWDNAQVEQDVHPLLPAIPEPVVSPIAYEPTVPLPLSSEEPTPEQLREDALAIVELHHQRVAHTIRALWKDRECGDYINKLLMSGDDGAGHARVGFHQEAVDAMLALTELHEYQFQNR